VSLDQEVESIVIRKIDHILFGILDRISSETRIRNLCCSWLVSSQVIMCLCWKWLMMLDTKAPALLRYSLNMVC